MALVALGASMALGGMGYYTYRGITKAVDQEQVLAKGGWKTRVMANRMSIQDPTHITYSANQPVAFVQKGLYGLPMTYYGQANGSLIYAYGRPETNTMGRL